MFESNIKTRLYNIIINNIFKFITFHKVKLLNTTPQHYYYFYYDIIQTTKYCNAIVNMEPYLIITYELDLLILFYII